MARERNTTGCFRTTTARERSTTGSFRLVAHLGLALIGCFYVVLPRSTTRSQAITEAPLPMALRKYLKLVSSPAVLKGLCLMYVLYIVLIVLHTTWLAPDYDDDNHLEEKVFLGKVGFEDTFWLLSYGNPALLLGVAMACWASLFLAYDDQFVCTLQKYRAHYAAQQRQTDTRIKDEPQPGRVSCVPPPSPPTRAS